MKHGVNRARKVARLGEVACGSEAHRRVTVVAAGVHITLIFRRVGQTRFFIHRQTIHVGAQAHGTLTGAIATDHTDNARAADAGVHLVNAIRFQPFGDDGGGARFFVGVFRVGVDITTDLGEIAVKFADSLSDFAWVVHLESLEKG